MLEHVAVDQDEGVLVGDAHGAGELGVQHQVAVLAVDGDEVLRAHQGLDDLQLFLGGVAADVDVGDAVVEHVGAEPEEVVDGAVDERLVAGDGRGGEDDGVAGLDLRRAGGRRWPCG